MSPFEKGLNQYVELTINDILTSSGKFPDRPVKYRPLKATLAHAADLCAKLNRLQMYWQRQLVLSSGYRPPAINAKTAGAAKHSLHQICAAADIVDPEGKLGEYCLADLPMLEHIGLYLEDPSFTPTWCHLQLFAPRSGRRVFAP